VALTIQMSVAFRSLRIGLISLIPNIFPILLVIGTMGWIGLPVNIATAMIASVSLGLTVDSSVHYITSYHAARRRGASVSNALEATNQGVGLALVFANVALVAGFSVLTLSHFIPLVYFGILVSVSMLGGLFGNLVLLPLLLRMVDANPRGSSEPAAVGDV
jgi:predicted RND superfamily exporter protein